MVTADDPATPGVARFQRPFISIGRPAQTPRGTWKRKPSSFGWSTPSACSRLQNRVGCETQSSSSASRCHSVALRSVGSARSSPSHSWSRGSPARAGCGCGVRQLNSSNERTFWMPRQRERELGQRRAGGRSLATPSARGDRPRSRCARRRRSHGPPRSGGSWRRRATPRAERLPGARARCRAAPRTARGACPSALRAASRSGRPRRTRARARRRAAAPRAAGRGRAARPAPAARRAPHGAEPASVSRAGTASSPLSESRIDSFESSVASSARRSGVASSRPRRRGAASSSASHGSASPPGIGPATPRPAEIDVELVRARGGRGEPRLPAHRSGERQIELDRAEEGRERNVLEHRRRRPRTRGSRRA